MLKSRGSRGQAPHDLRRTCARLGHGAGGELKQIQFLLGHRSVETTERYLVSRQRLVHVVSRFPFDRRLLMSKSQSGTVSPAMLTTLSRHNSIVRNQEIPN
jgi:hypothetical protein